MSVDPATIFGWLAAILLVLAMIPQRIRLIRLLSVAAGACGLAGFAISGSHWLVLLLALAFLLINAAHLLELTHLTRSGAINREEARLLDHLLKVEDPARQNRLRDLIAWRDVPVGERLIEEGQRDPPLIYIASGQASIEHDGRIVSKCAAGEFVGEMSLGSGDRASATVTVTRKMRAAQLDREALAQLTRSLPEVGRALDAAFNRSLAIKVLRMNEPGVDRSLDQNA